MSAARRQATAIKCGSQLRELGNAMFMYANDNKGYLPVPRQWTSNAMTYDINGLLYKYPGPEVPGEVIAENPKWWHFLAKYLSKGNAMAQSSTDADIIKKGVFWCPSFEGYYTGGNDENMVGGINRNFTGYGMNWWPKFTANDPGPFNANGFPSGSRQAERFSDPLGGNSGGGPDQGTWFKLVHYTQPAERALLADARYWFLEAKRVPAGQPIPGQRLLGTGEYSAGVTGQRQTTYDFYRHGKYPEVENANPNNGYYRAGGGKVNYNILYADGHVEAAVDRETGYKACRMRFPD